MPFPTSVSTKRMQYDKPELEVMTSIPTSLNASIHWPRENTLNNLDPTKGNSRKSKMLSTTQPTPYRERHIDKFDKQSFHNELPYCLAFS